MTCMFSLLSPARVVPTQSIDKDPLAFLAKYAEESPVFQNQLGLIKRQLDRYDMRVEWRLGKSAVASKVEGSEVIVIRIDPTLAEEGMPAAVIVLSILAKTIAECIPNRIPPPGDTKDRFIAFQKGRYIASAVAGVEAQLRILLWAIDKGFIRESDVPESQLKSLLVDFNDRRDFDNFQGRLLPSLMFTPVKIDGRTMSLLEHWTERAEKEWLHYQQRP